MCFRFSNFASTQSCPRGFFHFFGTERKRSAEESLVSTSNNSITRHSIDSLRFVRSSLQSFLTERLDPIGKTRLIGTINKEPPVTMQMGKSQNGCFKKTKHAKCSEKRIFLSHWYAQVRRVSGYKNILKNRFNWKKSV